MQLVRCCSFCQCHNLDFISIMQVLSNMSGFFVLTINSSKEPSEASKYK